VREVTAGPRFDGVCVAMLRGGLTVRFRAPGTSMLPTIHDDDVLTVEAVDVSRVRRGDVLVVSAPSFIHAHRVVRVPKRGDGFFLLRGDSLTSCDAPVPSEYVLGRVAWVERGGRRFPVRGIPVWFRTAFRRFALGGLRIVARSGIRDWLCWWPRCTTSITCLAGVTPAREVSSPQVRAKGS